MRTRVILAVQIWRESHSPGISPFSLLSMTIRAYLVPFSTFTQSMVDMIGSPDVLLSENVEPGCCKSGLSLATSTRTPTCSRPALGETDTNGRRCSSSPRRIESKFPRHSEGKLVIVEGNIGVGKTTLTQKLAADLNYQVFLEPSTDNPFLERFYADPHQYALKLQLWILRQRYHTYVSALKHIITTGQGVILDRSVYSDCVFANVCHKEGFISQNGYLTYQYWRNRTLEHLPLPHITVFLDAQPRVCQNRIQKRARECESGVSLDYLEKLHEEYIKFIDEMMSNGSQVLRYDWSTFKDETIAHVCEDIKAANRVKWSELPSNDELLSLKFPLAEE